MTFVSKKDLAFIHLVSRELPAGVHISQSLKQCFDLLSCDSAGGIPIQPLSKSVIQSFVLGARDLSSALDGVLVGAEGYISH